MLYVYVIFYLDNFGILYVEVIIFIFIGYYYIMFFVIFNCILL